MAPNSLNSIANNIASLSRDGIGLFTERREYQFLIVECTALPRHDIEKPAARLFQVSTLQRTDRDLDAVPSLVYEIGSHLRDKVETVFQQLAMHLEGTSVA